MTERKVKLDRANKSILLRALGDVYYGQRARGGSAEETGRLILRVNDLPAGGKLTMSAAEYRLAKAALNQLRTQRFPDAGGRSGDYVRQRNPRPHYRVRIAPRGKAVMPCG